MKHSIEIIEANKLIAAFLDGEVREVWKINGKSSYAWCGEMAKQWRKEKLGIDMGICVLENQLCFHLYWEWLMPVLEKIQSIDHRRVDLSLKENDGFPGRASCMIIGYGITHGKYPQINIINKNSLFEAAYEAVVSFILWYNESNQI